MRHVGNEIAAYCLEPAHIRHVVENEQRAAVLERPRRYDDRAVTEVELAAIHHSTGHDLAHQRAVLAIVKQLGERRQRLGGRVAEQPAGGRIDRDDGAAAVGGEDAVREGFEERPRFLALAPQVVEAALELMMHRAQGIHMIRELRHAYVGKLRRAARGDIPRRGGDVEQRPRQEPREHPRDERGREQHHEAGGRDGSLPRVHLRVDDREGCRHAYDGEAGRATPDGDIHLPFVGRCAQPLVHPHA